MPRLAQLQSLAWSWLCFLQLQVCLLSASFSTLLWLSSWSHNLYNLSLAELFWPVPLSLFLQPFSPRCKQTLFVKLRCTSLKIWRQIIYFDASSPSRWFVGTLQRGRMQRLGCLRRPASQTSSIHGHLVKILSPFEDLQSFYRLHSVIEVFTLWMS